MQSQIFSSVQMLLLMFKKHNYPDFSTVVLMIQIKEISLHHILFSESVFCIITRGVSAAWRLQEDGQRRMRKF